MWQNDSTVTVEIIPTGYFFPSPSSPDKWTHHLIDGHILLNSNRKRTLVYSYYSDRKFANSDSQGGVGWWRLARCASRWWNDRSDLPLIAHHYTPRGTQLTHEESFDKSELSLCPLMGYFIWIQCVALSLNMAPIYTRLKWSRFLQERPLKSDLILSAMSQ